MSREVLAFVPHFTPSKSRILAIVDKGNGREIDAIATLDHPHEVVAVCNMLNAYDEGQFLISGLWASLPSSVRANLEQAKDQLVGEDDERRELAFDFINEIRRVDLPDRHRKADWAQLFPISGCPDEGCDQCDGCTAHAEYRHDPSQSNQCAPNGRCRCLTEDLDDCCCPTFDVGPRWASAIHESLIETAEALVDHAIDLNWGVEGPAVGFPRSLIAQPPAFYMRLASTCVTLSNELAAGRLPVPHTIAELLMLDEAARSYLTGWTGGNGLELDEIRASFRDLPEAHGDFEMGALWVFQFTSSDWIEIADSEEMYEPESMNRVFDLLPEAADWPRPQS